MKLMEFKKCKMKNQVPQSLLCKIADKIQIIRILSLIYNDI